MEIENCRKTCYAVVFPIILHEVEYGLTKSVVLFQHMVSMLYNDESWPICIASKV